MNPPVINLGNFDIPAGKEPCRFDDLLGWIRANAVNLANDRLDRQHFQANFLRRLDKSFRSEIRPMPVAYVVVPHTFDPY